MAITNDEWSLSPKFVIGEINSKDKNAIIWPLEVLLLYY